MDDILAVVIFFAACCVTGLFVRHLLKAHEMRVKLEKDRQALIERMRERDEADRKKLRESANKARAEMAKSVASNNPPKKREFVKRDESFGVSRGTEVAPTYYAQSPTQSILSDVADIAMIANTIHHWNDNSRSEPVREERSVGVSKTESSWGFDDSDSRKSISSSMDTSSSWSSSSSDSYSSSSDSGPSSDW
jgi:hypothetical protein